MIATFRRAGRSLLGRVTVRRGVWRTSRRQMYASEPEASPFATVIPAPRFKIRRFTR
jgi:hypothetical protein